MLFVFLGVTSLSAQSTDLDLALRKAAKKIMSYLPEKFSVEEEYSTKVDIEFPNGYNFNADENIKAIVKYKWKEGKALKLKFDIDADGNITANRYYLKEIFGTNWDVNWNIRFNSSGMLISAKSYWDSFTKGMANWWAEAKAKEEVRKKQEEKREREEAKKKRDAEALVRAKAEDDVEKRKARAAKTAREEADGKRLEVELGKAFGNH